MPAMVFGVPPNASFSMPTSTITTGMIEIAPHFMTFMTRSSGSGSARSMCRRYLKNITMGAIDSTVRNRNGIMREPPGSSFSPLHSSPTPNRM